MACQELGLHEKGPGRATLRVSKIADTREAITFSTDYDFTGWTGTLTVRADEDSATLLTVTETPTAEDSQIIFEGRVITILLKAADNATLPDNDDDAGDPWTGVWDLVIVDPDTADASRLLAGAFVAEKR